MKVPAPASNRSGDRPGPVSSPAQAAPPRGVLFGALFGLLLGIGLLKWGNPVILDRLVEWPRHWDEWRVFAWPVATGHVGLAVVSLLALGLVRENWRPNAPRWAMALLVGWFVWQWIAAVGTIDPAMTPVVLMQYTCCLVCFLLGNMALARVEEPRVFWLCLVLGFLGVMGVACDQHFGGLEATRKMIFETTPPERMSPEHLARIRSNRVFSTLVYPNALAGAILLMLPVACVQGWSWGIRRGRLAAGLVAAGMACLGLVVLYWSGSKAGWLLVIAMLVFVLLHGAWSIRLRMGIAVAVIVVGLIGFRVAFAEKLRQGSTSVSARFDYWSAALGGFRASPWVGHGPGAFKKVYAAVKRPESEMAQLAHNDFLQQACDSGLPGFVGYLGFVLGSLGYLYRRRWTMAFDFPPAAWLGLAAWWAHGMVEFGLYIPATSWLAFAWLGWLLAQKPSEAPIRSSNFAP